MYDASIHHEQKHWVKTVTW